MNSIAQRALPRFNYYCALAHGDSSSADDLYYPNEGHPCIPEVRATETKESQQYDPLHQYSVNESLAVLLIPRDRKPCGIGTISDLAFCGQSPEQCFYTTEVEFLYFLTQINGFWTLLF